MARPLIGRNVLYWRTAAGMTQNELAQRAGCTKQYISQIENNKRAVIRRTTFENLVRALGVSANDLTGQPYLPLNTADLTVFRVVPQVRAALDEPDQPTEPRPISELALATDRAMMARMACDMDELGQHLPPLLADTRLLWFDRGDREAGALLVKAAVTGSLAFKAAGFIDLAIRLADVAEHTATVLGDPVCVAAAQFAVAQCALATGARKRSARLAAVGADVLDNLTRTRIPPMMRNDALAWLGMLHLHAALAEAPLETGDPDGHLAAADVVARHVTGDPWFMECTPTNVATWRVAVALEDGNPDRAPELARLVDVNQLHTPQRRSRLYLDAGRGHFAAEDYDSAVQALLAADRAAPGDLRQRTMAVEMVGHMVREAPARRGGSAALRDLAVRVGVTRDTEA